MKISKSCATLLLLFWPKKLIQKTNAHYEWMRTEAAIAEKQKLNDPKTQAERSVKQIRSSLFWSFVLVAGAVVAAMLVGKLYFALGGQLCKKAEEILQYSGIAVLLWATLSKVGWSIQTLNGTTIPELVNEWIFRALYVLGSFLLALAVSLAFGS